MTDKIRKFKGGATRDTDKDKLDYEGFLSPIVLKAFAEYMHRHRKQSDGNMRDSDNWQRLFGEDHFDVCMKSLLRHVMDLWLEHRGFKSRDGKKDALCGILFNAKVYLYKLLIDEEKKITRCSKCGSEINSDNIMYCDSPILCKKCYEEKKQ